MAAQENLAIAEPEGRPTTLVFAARTDVGRERDHNEDNFLVDKKLRLFVVCDGMGGHAAGEVASAIAVRTLSDEVRRAADMLRDYLAGETGGNRVSERDVANMLTFAVNSASRRIHREASADSTKRGMGTTLAAVLFVGHQAFIVHVGDSRVYLCRKGGLEQLTEDHNVDNEYIKKNLLDSGVDAVAHKLAITRAVGVYEHCEPDLLVLEVAAGDRFLLASDGLTGYFESPMGRPDELLRHVMQSDLEAGVGDLVRIANERGGSDNITAVLVALADQRSGSEASRLELQRSALASSSLFDSLESREARRVLQAMERCCVEPGQRIVHAGDEGERLFVVVEGSIELIDGNGAVRTLRAGAQFGARSLTRQRPLRSSATALERSELLSLHRDDLLEILRTEHRLAVKLLWRLAGLFSERLDALDVPTPFQRGVDGLEDIQCDLEEG